MSTTLKKFDVKHGLSVNGLEFVDENRNVTLNNLTVQGTSTVIDTRTVTSVDPIISLGTAGSEHTITEVVLGSPGRLKFSAEAFDDIAVGDSFEYLSTVSGAAPLTPGVVYYVVSKETDVTSANYRTITVSSNQPPGATATAITGAGSGTQSIVLNPLRDLGQDLGIEFNYVESGGARTGFFGFDDSAGRFTFLLNATYRGQSTQSDDGTPVLPDFIGTKSGAEFSYAKLEPSASLASSQAAIDIDQTWDDNEVGVTFKTIEVDIVDTDSANASSFLDFKLGTAQKLLLRKDGVLSLNTTDQLGVLNLVLDGTTQATTLKLIDGSATWNDAAGAFIGLDLSITQTAYNAASKLLSISADANRNFIIDAEGETIHRAEFTGTDVQTALLVDVTNTASGTGSLLLDLQVGDTSKFSVDLDGNVTVVGDITVQSGGSFEDTITIRSQTNDANAYADSTQFRSDTSTIAAGVSTATTITSFDASTFTSAEVLAQVIQGTNIHTSKLLLIHNGTDIWLTEYGTVYNSDILVTFDATISGTDVLIQATNTASSAAANALTTVKSLTTSINT